MMCCRCLLRTALLCCLIGLGGCAAEALHRSGMQMVSAGQVEAGLAALAQAVQADPRDVVLRKDYYMAKNNAANALLASARTKQASADYAGAAADLRRLQTIDPANGAASQGLQNLRRSADNDDALARARRLLEQGEQTAAAALLRSVLADDPDHRGALGLQRTMEQPRFRGHFAEPSLNESYPKPINLDFRDASVRQVLEALSNASAINFIFDKDVSADLRTTIVLRNTTIDEALDLILRNCQLRRKVLNQSTVQIYPDTPDKRKEYQELVLRAFYLQDASAAQIQTVLKTMLKLKDIVIDERLNLVTVRDTPQAIQLSEQLVALHDLAEPEVMLELEVLEVQRDDLLKLGLQWPNQFTAVLPSGVNGAALTIDELKQLNGARLGLSFNNPALSLRQDVGTSKLLANPRIRVHNREKANILIGDKVPVITTTSNATGFVAENVQYLDVGLKLTVEPQIHPGSDVSIRLNLEVSSIASQVSTPNGSVAYQIGTRNAATFLRLRDGETQVLAGLISEQDRHSASGVPGLSRLPLLGRLFGTPSDSTGKTEIVLSVTPHVVRPPLRAASQPVQFWSGTENGLDTKPLRLADHRGEPAAPVAAPLPVVPTQFIWTGPNQVAAGSDFTLALRAIVAPGTAASAYQVVVSDADFEIVDALAAPGADGNTVALERATHAIALNLATPMDGPLLTLMLRARHPVAASALQVVVAGPAGVPAATPYLVKVTP